jgi:hypothetical protein
MVKRFRKANVARREYSREELKTRYFFSARTGALLLVKLTPRSPQSGPLIGR